MRSIPEPKDWIDRTRAGRPPGSITTAWSRVSDPPVRVPVTTVPLPLAAKTRSIHSRGRDSVDRLRRRGDQVVERRPQVVETLTGRHRDRHDPRIVQERLRHVVADVEHCQLAALVVDQIDLGEGDDAVADAEQFEDAEVLLRLRLPPLGRGDHEQAGVDAADTGQHVAQETHMAGDVDEADRRRPTAVSCGRNPDRS